MERDVVIIVVTALVSLFGRFLWDRFFSRSSRVTAKECKDRMATVEKNLNEGEETFKNIKSCLAASCLIMLQLCERAEIDCGDIRQKIVESGLNL